MDIWGFQTEALILSKLLTITAIHCVLAAFIFDFGTRQSRLPVPLPYFIKQHSLARLACGVVIGILIGTFFSFIARAISPFTAILFHAGFLTIWYIEAAYLLAHGFFKNIFDDELPFEITLFISFVLMVNAGYFTLMISLSLLRAPTL